MFWLKSKFCHITKNVINYQKIDYRRLEMDKNFLNLYFVY